MGLLEDALRDTLAAQVVAPPAVHDAAGRAIGRARHLHRRRAALTIFAVVASLGLLGAGIATAPTGWTGSGVGLAPDTPYVDRRSVALAADVLAGNRIVLAAGGIVGLAELPPPRRAWRVAGGWLVTAKDPATATSTVWFVTTDGTAKKLATGDGVAVGRTGGSSGSSAPMVAWGARGQVSVAVFTGGRLGRPVTTGGTGELSPSAIVGGGVLLVEATAGGTETYAMWFPDLGAYAAEPYLTDPVIGVTGDGANLFALIGQRRTCLALIAPADFTVTRSRCDLDLRSGDVVAQSPDGRWLVALSRNGVDLYDFDAVWQSPAPVANWQVRATGVTWLADGSFIVFEADRVVRLRPDVPDREETAQVSVSGGEAVTGIADLTE